MNIPDHIRQRALSATQSNETAALLKNVQQGQPMSLTQKLLMEASKDVTAAAAQIGWAPLLAMTFVYASRITQQDQARKHKNRFLGIEL
jgi:hypothetical protein